MENKSHQRILKYIFIALAAALLVALLTAAAVTIAEKPPVVEVRELQKKITEAKDAGAESYAPGILAEAESRWASATAEWQYQNDKWFLNRDFSKMRNLIAEGTGLAQRAKTESLSSKGSLKNMLGPELSTLQKAINSFKAEYSHLPLDESIRDSFARSVLLMQEGEMAYMQRDYQKAEKKIKAGRSLLTGARNDIGKLLEDYLKSVPTWQSWAESAIAWSGQNKKMAIIVDKLAHTCRIYKNGKFLDEFEIEMGSNWIGDKRYKGDKATPEGRYSVVKKKGSGQTKYHKALLINYPNPEDRGRFKTEIKNGALPSSSAIGGAIEIHGEGGKGINWTDGCVALRNEDMDRVYELADAGTQVIIVGSLSDSRKVYHR